MKMFVLFLEKKKKNKTIFHVFTNQLWGGRVRPVSESDSESDREEVAREPPAFNFRPHSI